MADYYFEEPRSGLTPQQHCANIADFLQENPGAWTTRYLALNGMGFPVSSLDPEAAQWCAQGLIDKFSGDASTRRRISWLLTRVITPRGEPPKSYVAYNDHDARDVYDIISLFRAASLLEEANPLKPPTQEILSSSTDADEVFISMYEKFLAKYAMGFSAPNWWKLAGAPPLLTHSETGETISAPGRPAEEEIAA